MNDLLSLVVVHFNVPREFPRTLYSLSPAFQEGITGAEYEVIVVDNGSAKLPDLSEARELGMDVHMLQVKNPTMNPARAINMGLNASCGRYVGVFIDGARIASPGLLKAAREALQMGDRIVVGSRGRYLGPAFQRDSMCRGYTPEAEDALLESINWRKSGYRLFEASVFDESSGPHWHGPISESNSLFMCRTLWRELGGYAEEFTSPGGGYLNLDTWRRACLLPGVTPVVLLGEATFHQLHGGVATNVPKENVEPMYHEYTRIRGEQYSRPPVRLRFWGNFPQRPPLRELGLTKEEMKQFQAGKTATAKKPPEKKSARTPS